MNPYEVVVRYEDRDDRLEDLMTAVEDCCARVPGLRRILATPEQYRRIKALSVEYVRVTDLLAFWRGTCDRHELSLLDGTFVKVDRDPRCGPGDALLIW